MLRKWSSGWIGVALVLLAAACSRDARPSSNDAAKTAPAVAAAQSAMPAGNAKCVVVLHGKGERAQKSTTIGDVTYLRPSGNADGWGGRQWLYYPEDRYREVHTAVANAINDAGCARVIVHGFSNGAAAAAKLYCRGERFDNKVTGYIIDDPVPDHAVDSCQPGPGLRVRLYWTGALSVATDGWPCATQDWTCEGGRTIGIDSYARALATEINPSIHTTHTEYASPPEQTAWLNPGE